MTCSVAHRFLTLFFALLALVSTVIATAQPLVSTGALNGAPGDKLAIPVSVTSMPENARLFEAVLHVPSLDAKSQPSIGPGAKLPNNSNISIRPTPDVADSWSLKIVAPEGGSLPSGELVRVTVQLPDSLLGRIPVTVPSARIDGNTGITEPGQISMSLIINPATVFAYMAGVVGFVYWLSGFAFLQGFFRFFPPLIWMYFIPMLSTTLGITPDASALYSPFMSRIILPAVLVLLLIPSDIRGLSRLGIKAVIMMAFATTGIVVGAIGSFWIMTTFFPGTLPPETWKGVAALSGSWIGGSPNMFAVLESVGTPPGIIGPLVIVDTVLAYSWLGLLIALSAYQKRIDGYHKASTAVIDEIASKLEAEQEVNSRVPKTLDIALMVGLAFVVSQLCLAFGAPVHKFFVGTLGLVRLGEVINAYGWGILLITAAGLLLSMTKVRQLEFCGASSIGYVGLYLLLTCYGAQANLRAIMEVPAFFGLGFIWIVIHVFFLYVGIRVLRAPLVLGATSSMANIGGTASAPVVAASYNQSLAPLGLLLAILGGILGTPLALFVVGFACKAIAGE